MLSGDLIWSHRDCQLTDFIRCLPNIKENANALAPLSCYCRSASRYGVTHGELRRTKKLITNIYYIKNQSEDQTESESNETAILVSVLHAPTHFFLLFKSLPEYKDNV